VFAKKLRPNDADGIVQCVERETLHRFWVSFDVCRVHVTSLRLNVCFTVCIWDFDSSLLPHKSVMKKAPRPDWSQHTDESIESCKSG